MQGSSLASDAPVDEVPVMAPNRYSSTIQQLIQSSVNPLTSTVTTLVHAMTPAANDDDDDDDERTSTLTTQQIRPNRHSAYGYSGAYRTSSMKRKVE